MQSNIIWIIYPKFSKVLHDFTRKFNKYKIQINWITQLQAKLVKLISSSLGSIRQHADHMIDCDARK